MSHNPITSVAINKSMHIAIYTLNSASNST